MCTIHHAASLIKSGRVWLCITSHEAPHNWMRCAFSLSNATSGMQHTNICSGMSNESHKIHTFKITVVLQSSGLHGREGLSGLPGSGQQRGNVEVEVTQKKSSLSAKVKLLKAEILYLTVNNKKKFTL